MLAGGFVEVDNGHFAYMTGELLTAGSIAPRLAAQNKRQVLSTVAEIAARSCRLKAPKVVDALMERECLGTTGVGYGVAIPHARVEGLDRVRGVFARINPPVEYNAVDDEPVDLVFALLSPADSGSEHLRALARIARALRSAELRGLLRQASGADAIRALFVQEARSSAA